MPVAEKKTWPGRTAFWRSRARLFSVGNPDIFHLSRVLEEPATLGDVPVEPVDDSSLVGPDLLQVPDGHGLGGGDGGFISIAPDGVDVVVLGKSFQQLR